jgi:DNA-binding NarL/FixJ family response regulator
MENVHTHAEHGEKIVRILLIEDSDDTGRLISEYLHRFEVVKFEIIHKKSAEEVLDDPAGFPECDMVLMDYYLPGKNGLDATRVMKERKFDVPIAFLTVNKDVTVAVEAMKLGIADYFMKDDIPTHVFPQAIMSIVEKRRLQYEYALLEVKKRRLEAMQEIVLNISKQITEPLAEMKRVVEGLIALPNAEKYGKFLSIIKDNVDRMDSKLGKLKNLKDDKTVQYIKDIRMIDIS